MNKLAYWRSKRGLTVRELSNKSGVNPTAISRIEKGHSTPYLSTLGKLAAGLDIDVTELAELAETMPGRSLEEETAILVEGRREVAEGKTSSTNEYLERLARLVAAESGKIAS